MSLQWLLGHHKSDRFTGCSPLLASDLACSMASFPYYQHLKTGSSALMRLLVRYIPKFTMSERVLCLHSPLRACSSTTGATAIAYWLQRSILTVKYQHTKVQDHGFSVCYSTPDHSLLYSRLHPAPAAQPTSAAPLPVAPQLPSHHSPGSWAAQPSVLPLAQ